MGEIERSATTAPPPHLEETLRQAEAEYDAAVARLRGMGPVSEDDRAHWM
jgi:hypothetical protein